MSKYEYRVFHGWAFFETLDNADFRTICEDLMEQANDYLETWGEVER